MKQYPEYKDSGVEGVAGIPDHWSVSQLRYVVEPRRAITYGIVQAGPKLDDGVPYIRPADMRSSGRVSVVDLPKTSPEIAAKYTRSAVSPGDLIVSIGPSFGKVMVVPPELDGANLTQGTARVAVDSTDSNRFIYWVLHAPFVNDFWDSNCSGATFRALTLETLAQTPIPLPPLDEQRQLADYLDRKTGEIDALIQKKRALIDLLREQRSALVHRAVTKGLDPEVPTKDTGIEWLGEVPEHWDLVRVKSVIESSQNGIWGDEPQDNDEDLVCVRVADFDMDTLGVGEGKLTYRNVAERYQDGRLLGDGDLLIEKSGGGEKQLVGRVVRFNLNRKAVCSNFVARITPRGEVVDSDYLLYGFQLLYGGRVNYRSIKQTTGIQNLDASSYFDERIPLPSLDEQREISRYIAEQSSKIENLIVSERRLIRMLRELRTSLISEVVTGKIDVREEASEETAPEQAVLF